MSIINYSEILRFISEFQKKSDWYPNTKEISSHFGCTEQQVHEAVEHLKKKGYILPGGLAKWEIVSLNYGTPKLKYDTPKRRPESADLKKTARSQREAGEAIKAIAEALERHPDTVYKWCKGIKLSPAQCDVLGLLADGDVWKTSKILKCSRFARDAVTRALKILVDAKKIRKPKRGYYQKP